MAHSPAAAEPQSLRERLEALVHHLEHVLPGQAPIKDFVHHNTLHGFQHLPFPEALAEAKRITGIHAYLPLAEFRRLYRAGRIEAADLDAVLLEDAGLEADKAVGPVTRLDVYRAGMLLDLEPLTHCQLAWRMDETGLDEGLWQAVQDVLGLEPKAFHAEEIFEEERTPETLDETERLHIHSKLKHEADHLLAALLDRVGPDLTLRGFLLALTGRDVLDEIRPYLLRHLGSFLDQGLAAWHSPDRPLGFYTAWRRSALHDPFSILEEFANWVDEIEALPEDAVAAVEDELTLLGLPEERWLPYLERLALELPGWSGMVMWRSLRPGYQNLVPERVQMMDYLAVRLVLERLFSTRLCRAEWKVEPRLDMFRWHFKRRRPELLVRWNLFNARLPEFLASRGQRLLERSAEDPADDEDWLMLAELIWAWRQSPLADRPDAHNLPRSAWPLYHLAKGLGLSTDALRGLEREGAEEMLACLALLTEDRAGYLWLQAYERQYRDQILGALAANRGRGPWARRDRRPVAQVVFCMDDREEGIRRHLEERNPAIETLGAAAHFGVFINWRGLDDRDLTVLCPVVAVPSHTVEEKPQEGGDRLQAQHAGRRSLRLRLKDLVYRGTHRGLLGPALLGAAAAPGGLSLLAGKLLAPATVGGWVERLRERVDLTVPTDIALTAPDDGRQPSPAAPRSGFTDAEQADRVEAFLRAIGLTYGFAPFVVIMGHGSISQNNPHLAAYDCGACSGRHSGPNARTFAAMANRPEVRARLAERGIAIPDDCRFLGAEHNTCDEHIFWSDLDRLPEESLPAFAALRADLDAARAGSAHERCRRLASAPRRPTLKQALAHMVGRARDMSQARPELGHATNACALIGRRSVARGAFFDRRMFLISYDPTQDGDGTIIERLLLANGPVGAGISLEYYFSTVNNDRFGCGTKVVHNVTGFLGVMEGTSSDLRTGLPRQMIEIHEAMRLLVIVEQKIDVLTAIYQRQPAIQELVGNAWIQLAAIEPDGDAIHVFRPGVGWEPWRRPLPDLPTVDNSSDWYAGHTDPLPPALIAQPEGGADA